MRLNAAGAIGRCIPCSLESMLLLREGFHDSSLNSRNPLLAAAHYNRIMNRKQTPGQSLEHETFSKDSYIAGDGIICPDLFIHEEVIAFFSADSLLSH